MTVVKASKSRELGTRGSRRLRAAGKLPGVVYGLSGDSIPVSVEYAELRNAVKDDLNTLLTLDIDGDEETVIIRDLQRDAIKRTVMHADFIRIDPNQPIAVKVPIVLVGDDSEVINNGGIIEQTMYELEIEVVPSKIPSEIEADVSTMTLDQRIAVGDLVLPEGVVSLISEEISVAVPVIPRALKAEDEAADEEGTEEEGAEEGSDEGGEAAASGGEDSGDSGDSE